MLPRELHLKLIKTAMSQGGEYADIFVENRTSTSLVLDDARLEKVIVGNDSGVGIRLIYKGRTSYAFSNDLSEGSLMEAARHVSAAAKGACEDVFLDLSVRRPSVDFDIRLMPSDVPVENKIALVRRADRIARGADPRIKQVVAVYRDALQSVEISGSDGFFARDERVHTTAFIQVIASEGGVMQTGYEPVGGFKGFELFDEFNIEDISLRASRRAVMLLGARRSPGGRMPVIISSSAGGTMIHEAIGHGLEADLARQGMSVFSDKVGTQVASKLVTVVDDSTLPGRRGSFRFDDEGVPSQRTVLVEQGVLKGYLYDRLSAMKAGVSSTGNGRRESARHRPIPRMTNTFIEKGVTPPKEIIGSVSGGLLVTKMGGGQVNTVTGDFVFEVQEGYLISHGLVGDPVREATISGNGPEVLQSIDMVGNDLGFSIGTCGKDAQGVPVTDGMPTIRIPEMVVGGACN